MCKKELIYRNGEHSYYMQQKDDKVTFFKNEIEILNQEGVRISQLEFTHLIKEKINEYIYPFESIVLLAGAGASIVSDKNGKPDLQYGHTMEMLSEKIWESLKGDDIYSIQDLSELCKYTIDIEKDGKFNSEFNLEDFLSKVVTYEDFLDCKEIKEKYVKTKNEILKIIKDKTSYEYNIAKHKHAALIKTLSNMHKPPNRLTVVTTNYDTLFEDAANSFNFTVFDGFSFDSKANFDQDLFDWSFVKPIANVKSEKMEYKKSTITLLKIHGSLTWKKIDDNIVRVGKKDNDMPIMIFPSSNKYSHSYEKPYFELFSKFQELIKKPNTLLITTGFSFADNHISKMITQAIKTSPSLSLLITDYTIDQESKCKNWEDIWALMESRYRISFLKSTIDTGLSDFLGDY